MNTEKIRNAVAVVLIAQRYVASEVKRDPQEIDRASIAAFIRKSDEQEKAARAEAQTIAPAIAIVLDMRPEVWLHRFYRHLCAVAAPTRLVQACDVEAIAALQQDIRDLLVLPDSMAVASSHSTKIEAAPVAMKDAWRKALHAYDMAQGKVADTKIETAWEWLRENDPTEYKLPSKTTFCNYVSKARGAIDPERTNPRGGRAGRSIVRQSDT